MTDPDPLEERLRRLRPSALPAEVRSRFTGAPSRKTGGNRRVIRIWFAAAGVAAAAAAGIVVFLANGSSPVPKSPAMPVVADTSSRRVEDVRPLAVIAEGRRAWELVEVKWVDESTLTSTADGPLAVQALNTHRTIVPVEIALD